MKHFKLFLTASLCMTKIMLAGAQDTLQVKPFTATDSIIISYKLKWADKSFDNMAYIRAKESYEEIVSTGYQNENIIRSLAISCYNTEDTRNAEKYYSSLIEKYPYTAIDAYNYAQTLKNNEKYSESDKWMAVFANLKTVDSRIERQSETSAKLKMLKETNSYSVNSVSFNTEYSDFGPSIFGNYLYYTSAQQERNVTGMKYSWNEKPYLDVYSLEISGDGTTGASEFMKYPVNSRFHDGPVCFNTDSSEMFLTRNGMFYYFPKKSTAGISYLRILRFVKKNGKWKSPEEMPFNSREYSTGHPSLTADGKRLYFASDMPGGYGGSDIYYVERLDTGWSAPVNLGNSINTEGNEMFPFIHSSGLLYFASDGHLGLGGLDEFVAKQKDLQYVVKNLGAGINSEMDDFSLILDNDGKTGYFSSNRPGGKGDDDIYKFDVLKPVVFDLGLKIIIVDKETGETITQAKLSLKTESVQKTDALVTDGIFTSEISPDKIYSVDIAKEGYENFSLSINTETATITNGLVEITANLRKLPPYGIYGKVYIKETMEAVPEVKISVKALNSDTSFVISSNENGEFRTQLSKETSYELLFEKEGFFTKRAAYSTFDRPAGYVNVNEFVDLSFEKIELNKTIEIPNIYYDLGKWNIRNDAAIELDKVVLFLQDNADIKIELGSHTDSRGTATANQSLSQKRAQSAVDYIVSKGINSDRITAMGYGEAKIKNQCADGVKCSEADHQQNRRTEIRIVGF